ncbi:hypothetical protein [Klebsiella pneumoniae]|uniref:hypothetical protein n=1 Tax=Klebsiella pneumoniae TaxID=573 RepID=UPI002D1F31D2|nr:hypothetical protein [Klebsiella pneumoniae]MEB4492263.1 hypothetical protein [Klebsiella pneumoniae]
MSIGTKALHDAMFSCTEGYVQLIVDSLEFELGRSLSTEEEQDVFLRVEAGITGLVGTAEIRDREVE